MGVNATTGNMQVEVVSGTLTATIAPASGALTNRSGVITLGGTAQTLIAANSSRKYLFLLNPPDATETLWFDFTTTAMADSPSIPLYPGQSFEMAGFVSTQAVSVIAATTNHKIIAKEG